MAALDTKQLAQSMLGDTLHPPTLIYHQELTETQHLKTDKLRAGDFVFGGITPPGSNATHIFENSGLSISIERPANLSGPTGADAFVELHRAKMSQPDPIPLPEPVPLPNNFVLTATFRAPKQVSLIEPPDLGTYGPLLMLFTQSTFMGASAQFRKTGGMRLNLPGTGNQANRPIIEDRLFREVIRSHDPAPFTLVLHVNRSANASKGNAFLFVGNQKADSLPFGFKNGLTSATVLESIGTGLGTADGNQYRSKIHVLEFEVWAKAI